MHDTYVRVMDRISVSRFDAAARAYLFQTATNLARDHCRRQRFRAHARLDEMPEETLLAPSPSPEEALAADQVTTMLREALDELSPETRSVFILARSHGMSYPEIADHLHMARRTVERRMAEAMAFLALHFGSRR